MSGPIVVAAVVLWSESGEMLLVRKRGTNRFMHPGGKLEPGESPREAAHREVFEEVGLTLCEDYLHEIGEFRVAAANEPGRGLHATVFEYRMPVRASAVRVRAELEELRWLAPEAQQLYEDLAPLVAPVLHALNQHGQPLG